MIPIPILDHIAPQSPTASYRDDVLNKVVIGKSSHSHRPEFGPDSSNSTQSTLCLTLPLTCPATRARPAGNKKNLHPTSTR
jgi:hypothetical protein